jgi:predicted Ser/Thr protein kinase
MTDTKTPDSLRPGDLVGPWRVEGYAGRGTYGAVYRARRAGHPSSMPVALKIAVFPSDPRFSREVELLSRNRHPGMPQLLDRGWWQASEGVAHPYVVMEWIRGRPLYEWARVHNPTCREVLLVLAQVAWTLEVLHRGECLHRDVKGDNILVEPEGRAVLTDFGSGTWKGAPPLTERVIPPNTREYRSPESLRFEWTHWRTKGAHYESHPPDDLYALGVTAYRLVAGGYPPPGTDPEALKEQLQVPLPQRRPAHEFNRRVVPELSALIERMMAKEPEARGTAREIAEAAESAAEHASPEANEPFLDLEWPEAKAGAVPLRALPVSDAAPPVVEAAAAEPALARREHLVHSWGWRPGFVAAGSILVAIVGTCWLSPGTQGEPPEVVRAEASALDTAPDAGTRGLGDSTPPARLAAQEAPVAPRTGAIVQFPEKPLPGQVRPPCRGQGQVEINGGCWLRFAEVRPPCVSGSLEIYEWKGACYWPVLQRPRVQPRTAKPPR